jgi:general secretion pathway protein K
MTANVATIGQARAWLDSAELIAMTRVEDLLERDQAQTLAAGWLGSEREIALPDGGTVTARVEDGGNCFNLNSLVEQRENGALAARPIAQRQFIALMMAVGIQEGEATGIAASATDHVDSDSTPLPGSAEDGSRTSANRKMADATELRSVAGITSRQHKLLKPWLCALPVTELSPINVNTLLPEQAPLLAMLVPGKLSVVQARSLIAARPADGYGSVINFWAQPALAALEKSPEATQQTKVRTSFFKIRAQVDSAGLAIGETALIDARSTPARVVSRSFAEESWQ